MKLLPAPIPARCYTVAAAARRGISASQSARSLGCSNQRVDQYLRRYEKHHGPISPVGEKRSMTFGRTMARALFRCKACGSTEWIDHDQKRGYCSWRCSGISKRSLTREEIIRCIDGRYSGQSWTGLALLEKTDYQTIQTSIWIFLYETGDLTIDRVERIWRPVSGTRHKQAKWNWLVERCGFEPARNALSQSPQYPQKSQLSEFAQH